MIFQLFADSADTKGIRTRLSTGTLIMFGTSTTSLAALEDKVDSPLSSSGKAGSSAEDTCYV